MRTAFALLLGVALLAVTFAPRGIDVTLRNETGEWVTDVAVSCRDDAAGVGFLDVGGEGTATICPSIDTDFLVTFEFRGKPELRELDLYSHAGAVGFLDGTFRLSDSKPPRVMLTDVRHESRATLWALVPSDRWVRGLFAGVGILVVLSALTRLLRARRP